MIHWFFGGFFWLLVSFINNFLLCWPINVYSAHEFYDDRYLYTSAHLFYCSILQSNEKCLELTDQLLQISCAKDPDIGVCYKIFSGRFANGISFYKSNQEKQSYHINMQVLLRIKNTLWIVALVLRCLLLVTEIYFPLAFSSHLIKKGFPDKKIDDSCLQKVRKYQNIFLKMGK